MILIKFVSLKRLYLLIVYGREKETLKMDIKLDDYISVLRSIYAKVLGAENMAKEGKIWYSINKLVGLRQKIEKEVSSLNASVKDLNDNNKNE